MLDLRKIWVSRTRYAALLLLPWAGVACGEAALTTPELDVVDPIPRFDFVPEEVTMTVLPSLDGAVFSLATAVNSRGHVAGWSRNAANDRTAFFWAGDELVELGHVGRSTTVPQAINESDQIVGNGVSSAGYPRAFLWEEGVLRELENVGDPRFQQSWANGINAQGDVVGRVAGSVGQQGAIWRGGGAIELLGSPAGMSRSVLNDINDTGLAVGWAVFEGRSRAVKWSDEHGWTELARGDGLLDPSQATAVNSSGTIVGTGYFRRSGLHAFLWDGEALYRLPRLSQYGSAVATGISDDGVVVGWARTSTEWRPVVWPTRSQIIDIGEQGVPRNSIYGVSPDGAYMSGYSGVDAVVWSATPPTPEERIESLLAEVGALGLSKGQAQSLSTKLANALKSLEKANFGSAINQLEAFQNEVRAMVSSGRLDGTAGGELIDEAADIVSAIESER